MSLSMSLAASRSLSKNLEDLIMFRTLPPVRTGWRVSAGLLGAFALFGLVIGLASWFQTQPLVFTLFGVGLVFGSSVVCIVFLFVAISGRDPMNYVASMNGAIARKDRS